MLLKKIYTIIFSVVAIIVSLVYLLDTPTPAIILIGMAWAVGAILDKTINPANRRPEYTDEQLRIYTASKFILAGYISNNAMAKPGQLAKILEKIEGLADSEEDKAFYEEQFNIGRSVGFDPTDTCIKLRAVINDDDVYRHRLLEFLVYVVFIDGVMSFEEKNRLSRIAERLSIPSFKLERYIRQNKAISEFENFISTLGTRVKYEESKVCSNMEYNRGYVPHDEVTNSLEVFGLNKKSDFADVHSAYIKLMKKYHPDRLKARGISSDMVKVYVEKTKTIQRAYDILKKHFDVKR
ncbi:MAG: DnaJ domain-containing protein [Ruminobacter sp.]|nr:DnaJ domain-containing protein [Ruminobacter sp.]MBR1924390.1 DnaJ domain-containing protein [Ruminobacter sp.]